MPGDELHSREVRHIRVRVTARRMAGPSGARSSASRPGCWTRRTGRAGPSRLPGRSGRAAPGARAAAAPDVRGDGGAGRRARCTSPPSASTRSGSTDVAVGDDLLAPGWTAYDERLLADTYDVTALVHPGANVIAATLGDGWWRGRLGFKPQRDRATYGERGRR